MTDGPYGAKAAAAQALRDTARSTTLPGRMRWLTGRNALVRPFSRPSDPDQRNRELPVTPWWDDQ